MMTVPWLLVIGYWLFEMMAISFYSSINIDK